MTEQECRNDFPITKPECRKKFPITYEESREAWPVTEKECVDGHLCPEPPDGPTDLTVKGLTPAGGVNLEWDPVEGSSEYRLCRCVTITAPTTTADDGCPVTGTKYKFTVSALVDGVLSQPSNEVEWTPPDVPVEDPDPPTNFTATTTAGERRITLKWEHDGLRLRSFTLERRVKGETQWRTVNANIGPDAREWADTGGLSLGVEYEYRIRAVGVHGESDPVTTTATIPYGTVPAPEIGAKSSASTTVITMDLIYPADYRKLLTGFVLEVSADHGTTWNEFAGRWTTDPGATEMTVNRLLPDTMYWFRVKGILAAGGFTPVSVHREYSTYPADLTAVTGLVVDDLNQTSVDLHWNGERAATGYEVTLYDGETVTAGPQTTPNTWIKLPLEAGKSYRAEVRAVRPPLKSDPVEIRFATAAATPPPTNLQVSNVYIENWNVRVRWTDPVQDAAYLVLLIKNGETVPTRSRYGCSGSGGVTLPNVPGGTYTVQVRTEVSADRKSEWLVKLNHVVPNTPP
ncbi:fibronectin type III domain-containing protein [Streptomyces alboflavus]|uniref:fibronectin type III domain-containing protein n=1 Tax=Streptomyces alboflavus TaxID=67267 RepID=UPI0036AAD899